MLNCKYISMASNTSIGAANKGSKFQMQRLTLPENKFKFDSFMGEELDWYSPLLEDKFKEYRMNNADLLKDLGIKKGSFKDFWPSPQPQWDGIAFGRDKTLYLFEAKSHFSEITKGKKRDPKNDMLIVSSIMEIAKYWNIKDDKREIWCYDYYQISNRIAFTQKLKEISNQQAVNFTKVKMVFLNFVNDRTWSKDNEMVVSGKDWDSHYDEILSKMGVSREQLESDDIYIKNFDLDFLDGVHSSKL